MTVQPHKACHCKTVRVAVLSVTLNASEMLMPHTINTGTRLIEEGALLPESLGSESEAWTSFSAETPL